MSKRVDFDEFGDDYNLLLNERTRFFATDEQFFASYKVDILRRQLHTPTRSIHEYGCGIGRNIPFLSRAFPAAAISGSDISAASLAIAARNNPTAEFFLASEESWPAGRTYDVIFVAGVFHHIPVHERSEVARRLLDRLKSGGRMFVFEHNPLNPVTRHIVNSCPYDEDAVLLGRGALRGLLRAAGFAVERSAYCLFVPPRIPGFSVIDRTLAWLPLGGQYWMSAIRPA